ncbi:MAG: helix-turn-helix domain-containing protein [Halosimplex sp.]
MGDSEEHVVERGFVDVEALDRHAGLPERHDEVRPALARPPGRHAHPVVGRLHRRALPELLGRAGDRGGPLDGVGDPTPLQEAFERQGEDVSVRVDEVASRPTDAERSARETLSDRQRAALAAATDLGYYETPREATHEDVAAELG